MIDFKDPKEVNKFFGDWHEDENKRLQTIRKLRNQYKLTVISHPPKSDFSCPLHEFKLVKSCGIKSCQYYIGPKPHETQTPKQAEIAAKSKNCIFFCFDSANMSKNGRLTAKETANVLGITDSEVNSISLSAINKVKKASVLEIIEKNKIPKFKYIEGHCVNCEIHIAEEIEMGLDPDLIITPLKHAWCSEACKNEKPQWMFQIEKDFECDYLDALAACYTVHKSLENLSQILEIPLDLVKSLEDAIKARQKQLHLSR